MLRLITASALLAALATAQTSTSCNPLKSTCPSDAGLAASSFSTDFTAGADSHWTLLGGTALTYGSNGAQFTITSSSVQDPTIQSNFYIFGGRVDVTMRAAPGAGIVSAFVLQSDDLDEIDWEFIGSNTAQGQSNFFGKGDTTSYDRGAYHTVSTPQSTFHTYSIDWTSSRIQWLIDGVVVRTVSSTDSSAQGGARYPQTPMQVKIGSWVAGSPSNAPGTIAWAGGLTDFSQAPFNMFVKSVQITNYNPAASYKYGDNSGSWSSIQLSGAVAGSSPAASSSAAAVSSSVAPKSSFTTIVSSSTTSLQSSTSVKTSTSSTTSIAPISSTTGQSSKSSTTAINAAVSTQYPASSGFLSSSRTSSSATATSTGPVMSTGGASSLGVSAAGSLLGLAAALMLL